MQPCPLAKPKPKHWIEIELLDEAGKPVAGEPYRIRLTDNSIREGNLDEKGCARWDDIEAGICDVWWPNLGSLAALDGPEVKPVAAQHPEPEGDDAAAKPLAEPNSWIEIALVGEDGKPIDAERYRIRFPDGSEFEGILNDQGRAFFDNLDPGACELSFPDLAPGAWERI